MKILHNRSLSTTYTFKNKTFIIEPMIGLFNIEDIQTRLRQIRRIGLICTRLKQIQTCSQVIC